MANSETFFSNVYDVVAAYESGFVGAYGNPEAAEALRDQIKAAGGIPDGAMACCGSAACCGVTHCVVV